ncbi:hypothetical protein HPB47_021490 [Ixodes persulcatus]|uniref:Uncharacterized protein n=1 Tax=Ixodes persulcatus TaxID=34615 RepID=A0AC60QCE5_IXOPE|nr:hypothetical protein HPB47_021490 [Ixodes persulcatus]
MKNGLASHDRSNRFERQLISFGDSRGTPHDFGTPRVFLLIMHNQGKPAAPSQSRASDSVECERKTTIFFIIIVSVPLAILASQALFKLIVDSRDTVLKRPPTCCPKLVDKLLRSANTSLNPCSQFNRHSCSGWNYGENSLKSSFETNVQDPVIQGRLRTHAGQTIFKFYKACLSATFEPSAMVNQAIHAVVDVTRHYHPSNPRDALRLLLTISVLYGLSAPVQVKIVPGKQIIIQTPWPRESLTVTQFSVEYGYEALRVFNLILRTNVTLNKLRGAQERLFVETKPCNDTASLSNVTKYLIPGLEESDWRMTLAELYHWPLPNFMCPRSLTGLQQNFDVLMTNKSIRTETRVALLTMQAVAILTAEQIDDLAERHQFDFCFLKTTVLHFLWVKVTAERLTNPEQDALVRVIFDSIVKSVAADATNHLEATDKDEVHQRLGSIRLFLWKDIITSDIPEPQLADNIFQNYFSVLRYQNAMGKKHSALGVTHAEPIGSPFTSLIEFVGPSVLMIPPHFYLALHFDGDNEFGINTAAFGLLISIQLWSKLVGDATWGGASRKSYERQMACVSRDPTRETLQDWVIFGMALTSVRRALPSSQTHKWHEKKLDTLPSLTEKVDSLERSVQYMSKRFDEFEKEMKLQKTEIKDLSKRVRQMEEKEELNRVVQEQLQQEVNDLEFWGRRLNLEIHGIPAVQGENLLTSLNWLADKLEVPHLTESDVTSVHRLPAKQGHVPGIIVRFTRQQNRDEWLKGKNKLKGSTPRVFIQENLTRYNRELLRATKDQAKEKNYAFTWYTNGKVLVRRTEGARAIHIKSRDDLNQL